MSQRTVPPRSSGARLRGLVSDAGQRWANIVHHEGTGGASGKANAEVFGLAESDTGRRILGVIDGLSPKGIDHENDIKWMKDFPRQIGDMQ